MIEDEMILKGVKIGLETHITLPIKSKLFCSCSNTAKEEEEPNTRICPVCMGHPGTKPYMNMNAVNNAIKIALVFNCKILQNSFFSRKTYFYPDMSKNFQITQYEIPLCEKGKAIIKTGEKNKEIQIRRIHIEEDPAKILYHKESTYLDFNRCGSPLIEVVTEPDFSTSKEARIYLQKLMALLEYLDLSGDGKDEATAIKSDANISLCGGNRVEVKNIGGIREVEKALKYEFLRQKNMLSKNIIPERETRGWMDKLGISKSMRSKEFEEDYGYIFEPDLPYIFVDNKQIDAQKNKLPELPEEKAKRFKKQYNLNEKTIERLVRYKDLADLFEYLCQKIDAGIASSWTAGPILKTLNWNKTRLSSLNIDKKEICICLKNYINKKHSDFICEKIIQKMVKEAKNKRKNSYDIIVKKYGFSSSSVNIELVIKKIIEQNKKIFNEYKGGKKKALNFLVGEVMKESKGIAKPQEVIKIISKMQA